MLRALFIIVSVIVAFVLEQILVQVFGPWARPNLLLLLIVFFNLFRGIRYSILAALAAGFLKDSLSVRVFGLNIFAFVCCAYLTTFLKWYFYRSGSGSFRIALVFLISSANVFIHMSLVMMMAPVTMGDVFTRIFLPEVLLTTVATHYVFNFLKRCALKYSV